MGAFDTVDQVRALAASAERRIDDRLKSGAPVDARDNAILDLVRAVRALADDLEESA